MKRIISIVVVLAVTLPLSVATLVPVAQAETYENYQIFGTPTTPSKGRQLTDCLAGLDDFLYATIGNGFSEFGNDFTDYWRDFFLSASHYADVYGVERQLNKARYAVIASFLRCDVTRQKQVNTQYYKLEAELYFVRHFINTVFSGFPDRITVDAQRKQFAQEVIAYVTEKSPDPDDKDKQLALYSGYFDQFVAKYLQKVEQYRQDNGASDPAWVELKEKWDELMTTFSGFGKEVEGLGGDASNLVDAVTPDFNKDSSVIGQIISGIASKFDACAETDEGRYCASDAIKYLNDHDVVKESEEQRLKNILKTSKAQPKSFGEVMFAVEVDNRQKEEDINEVDMLTRYEVLYGNIGGSGIHAIIDRADALNKMITTGSIPSLKKVYDCADKIEDRQCKN